MSVRHFCDHCGADITGKKSSALSGIADASVRDGLMRQPLGVRPPQLNGRWPYTVAHALKIFQDCRPVFVFRSHRHVSIQGALNTAAEIQRAGYLVWIERTGTLATR